MPRSLRSVRLWATAPKARRGRGGEGNSHQAVFPLKLSADYGQGESWFVRVYGTDADGNVLVSAPGGWSAAVQQGDVVYPPVGGERLS